MLHSSASLGVRDVADLSCDTEPVEAGRGVPSSAVRAQGTSLRAVDGILLFTEEVGVAYTPLEQVAEGAAVLKERIAALRAAGLQRVDINGASQVATATRPLG